MKIGLLQLNATIGDYAENLRQLGEGYRKLAKEGAEIVVAPELFLCGYPPRDLLLRPDFIEAGEAALAQAAALTAGGPALCVGCVRPNAQRPGRPLWNAAAWLEDGRIQHTAHKALLPTYDVFDEDRYFEPAAAPTLVAWRGKKIGITICEDIWNDADFWPDRRYRLDPVSELRRSGAEVILNLSASPWYRGKEKLRTEMVARAAKDEGVPIVQVNMVGGNDELIFDGQSAAFDAHGKVLFQAPAFETGGWVVDLKGACPPSASRLDEEETVRRALALGIRDYVGKCGFRSVALGLSGGIDSAVVAALAVEALGPQAVFGFSLPARYSSPGSLSDAQALAHNLGIAHEVVSIENAFQVVEKELGPVFQGRAADAAEENVQSRLRGLMLMAVSNKFGHLVLTTGNKSELAVGYCTLYGDMCGALAPIADLTKSEVYGLARAINRQRELIPQNSISKPPSAELRPNQTDQDSLPDYAVLDQILELYVVQHRSKAEIVAAGFDAAVVADVLNKVTFSEYKRRQAAPGLKVSPRAFGMGRQIPVAQRFRT
ncbi:MAG: NAD+ synthase [Verrucomicrobium sp.]|nr:NAD+ synthase [Verrucomicrobium sp.]